MAKDALWGFVVNLHGMTKIFFKGQYHSSILPGNTDRYQD